jgi:hypothetical protein
MFDEIERLLVGYDEETDVVKLCFVFDSSIVDPDDKESEGQAIQSTDTTFQRH